MHRSKKENEKGRDGETERRRDGETERRREGERGQQRPSKMVRFWPNKTTSTNRCNLARQRKVDRHESRVLSGLADTPVSGD